MTITPPQPLFNRRGIRNPGSSVCRRFYIANMKRVRERAEAHVLTDAELRHLKAIFAGRKWEL